MVTAALVKELREKTGAGMMDCKKVLTETDGDMDGEIEGLTETEGLVLTDGDTLTEGLTEMDGEIEGEADTEGETEGEILTLGDVDTEGLTDMLGDVETLGETLTDGDIDGLMDGEMLGLILTDGLTEGLIEADAEVVVTYSIYAPNHKHHVSGVPSVVPTPICILSIELVPVGVHATVVVGSVYDTCLLPKDVVPTGFVLGVVSPQSPLELDDVVPPDADFILRV